MKKQILIILIIMLIFGMIACTENDNQQGTTGNEDNTPTENDTKENKDNNEKERSTNDSNNNEKESLNKENDDELVTGGNTDADNTPTADEVKDSKETNTTTTKDNTPTAGEVKEGKETNTTTTKDNTPTAGEVKEGKETNTTTPTTTRSNTNNINLIDKVPNKISILAFANLDELFKIELIKDMLESNSDAKEFLSMMEDNKINQMIFGAEKINMITNEPENMMILVSGDYDIAKIKEKSPNLTEEVTVKGVKGLTNPESNEDLVMLFITEQIIGLTTNSLAPDVVDAVRDNKNVLGSGSEIYRTLNSMNNNVAKIVLDLTSYGEQDLSSMSMSGSTMKATFGITTIGISLKNEVLSFDIATVLDKEDVTSTLVSEINPVIPSMYMMVSKQLFSNIDDEEFKNDIDTIVNNFKLVAEGKKLSTNIEIKTSTIDKFEKYAPLLMGGSF